MKQGMQPQVLIVGAGAAGIACALSVARHGVETLLLERAPAIGGTVANALIHTLGGLFNNDGDVINDGVSVELIDRLMAADSRTKRRRIGRTQVLNVDPDVYRRVVSAWVAAEPVLTCLTNAEVSAVTLKQGAIDAVTVRIDNHTHLCHPRAVVDCTGNAAVVRAIDPNLIEPGDALAGVIAVLHGAADNALAFPKGVALIKRIQAAVATGELPQACATVWPDTGLAGGEVYLKFNVTSATLELAQLDTVLEQLLRWLRKLPEFASATLAQRGELGIRDGGRILGEYRLTETDLKTARRFADALCRGCWPIEHWHSETGIALEYLPPDTLYEIPLRALRVRHISGLYAAGKCLSAEPRAQASARVAGTCWGMGDGLGRVLAQTNVVESS